MTSDFLSIVPALDHVYLVANATSPAVLSPLGGDPADFVVEQTYSVVADDFTLMQDFVIGEVQTQRILLGAALNEGHSFIEVADCHSQDLYEIVALVFDENSEGPELNDDFADAVRCEGAMAADLTYVPSDEMLDFQWGPHVLRTLMQHSTGCQFFVVGVAGLQSAMDAPEYQAAIRRAAVLLEMGFEPYPNSPYFFFDLQFVIPELPEHLALQQDESALETEQA